jgi:hypothetical protein
LFLVQVNQLNNRSCEEKMIEMNIRLERKKRERERKAYRRKISKI